MTDVISAPVTPEDWAAHAYADLRGYSAEALRVVAALSVLADDGADGSGEFGPGLLRLAARADVQPRTAARNLVRLVESGWLIQTAPGGNGPGARARYRLALPETERAAG